MECLKIVFFNYLWSIGPDDVTVLSENIDTGRRVQNFKGNEHRIHYCWVLYFDTCLSWICFQTDES